MQATRSHDLSGGMTGLQWVANASPQFGQSTLRMIIGLSSIGHNRELPIHSASIAARDLGCSENTKAGFHRFAHIRACPPSAPVCEMLRVVRSRIWPPPMFCGSPWPPRLESHNKPRHVTRTRVQFVRSFAPRQRYCFVLLRIVGLIFLCFSWLRTVCHRCRHHPPLAGRSRVPSP